MSSIYNKTMSYSIVLLLTTVGPLVGRSALADGPPKPLSEQEQVTANQINHAFRRAVQIVAPAVVSLHVTKNGDLSGGFHGARPGLGSGCIIDKRGYVITNNHVVKDTDKVEVLLADGRWFQAKEIMLDESTDLAIVKIDPEGKELPVAEFGDSDETYVGDFVFAVGCPFGLTQTVTSGIISFKGRQTDSRILGQWGYEDFIQTDATINKGNSGGPLVDLHGRVIGINSNILSMTGLSAGYGFAVPSNLAKFVTDRLIADKVVKRGYLGIALWPTTLKELRQLQPERLADYDKATKIDLKQVLSQAPAELEGVLVADVTPNAPAKKAGMKKYDIIMEINGVNMTSSNQLRNHIAKIRPGTEITCTVWRKDKKVEGIKITLADRSEARGKIAKAEPKKGYRRDFDRRVIPWPPEMRPNERQPQLPWPNESQQKKPAKLGINVKPLNSNLARQFGYNENIKGLIVMDVHSDSIARQSGLQVGDIIVQADGTKIPGTTQGRELLREIIQNADLEEKGIEMILANKDGRRTITIKRDDDKL